MASWLISAAKSIGGAMSMTDSLENRQKRFARLFKDTKADLSEQTLSEAGGDIRAVSIALKKNDTLLDLNMRGHPLSVSSCIDIAWGLSYNSHLTTLTLSGCSIDATSVRYLAKSLECNMSLETLHLDANKLGDEGATYLYQSLQWNNSLQLLNIASNGITSTGAHAIGSLLEANKTLKHLDLSHNNIKLAGASRIAAALIGNEGLKILNLECTRINTTAANRLNDALLNNIHLKTLHLNGNKIDMEVLNSIKSRVIADRVRLGNTPEPITPQPSSEQRWCWGVWNKSLGENGDWEYNHYDVITNLLLNDAYQLEKVTLKHGIYGIDTYTVDFSTDKMTQTNNRTKYSRPVIRMDPLQATEKEENAEEDDFKYSCPDPANRTCTNKAQQNAAFLGWCNAKLALSNIKIKDICQDFASGENLMSLVMALTGTNEQIPVEQPKSFQDKAKNINGAFILLSKHFDCSISCNLSQFIGGHEEVIMDVLWMIIHTVEFKNITYKGYKDRVAIFYWVREHTKGYKGVEVVDFGDSFRSGLAFLALIHSINNNFANYDGFNKNDKAKNLYQAFDIAKNNYGIPSILHTHDFIDPLDEISIALYLAMWFNACRTE